MSSDAERWKNKYFAKLEEVEKTEHRLGEQVHLLERVVVRVSLAAEGINPDLDRELGSLRTLLRRDDHNARELAQQLEQIEKQVLALDENKAGVPEKILEAIEALIGILSDVTASRDIRKQLKLYAKSLRDKVQEIREYPGLLAEFGQILAAALKEIGADSGSAGQRKEGFFSRLFAGRDSASAASQGGPEHAIGESYNSYELQSAAKDEGQESDTQAAGLKAHLQHSGDAAEPLNAAPVSAMAATVIQPTGNGDGGQPFSLIADRIHAILANLIEQLALPANMDKSRNTLQARLAAGLNWYELVPTLDDMALLVIAAVGRGQQEFEAFLKNLDDRLAGLQAFLSHSHDSHRASKVNSAELQQRVREHVTTLKSDVQSAGSLETLKHSVENNLDTIIHSLDDFMRKEAARETNLSEEMENLKARLKQMEEESGAIKLRLQEETRRAMTDVLTGLPNRVAYGNRADEEYARWKRYGRPLTLVVADIDLFKRINDSYGHLAGDRVLQLIGKEVAGRIRATDFLARYGGEELVILMPETPRDIALQVMDKTREMIGKLPFHFRNQKVQITMSFGISEFQGQDTIDSVFERADKALYKAKANGRNQVQVDGS